MRCLIATLLLAAPAAEAQQAICPGTYTAYQATLSGPGLGVFQGRRALGQAEVTIEGCGQRALINAGGQIIHAARGVDGIYRAEIQGDPNLSFSFSALSNTFVTGTMQASDDALTLNRSLDLSLVTRGQVSADCAGSAARPARSRATDVIADIFADKGLSSETGAVPDFITSATTDTEGRSWVSLLVGSNGQVLTENANLASLQALCTTGDRPGQSKLLLGIKSFQTNGETYVFAQVIEIETGKIIEQREGGASGTDEGALHAATRYAIEKLNSIDQ